MEEYLKKIAAISGELWKVFKAYCMIWKPETDEWWSDFSEALDAAAKKYYGTEFEQYARGYATQLVYEAERKSKWKIESVNDGSTTK
jgi:hypothetical protein